MTALSRAPLSEAALGCVLSLTPTAACGVEAVVTGGAPLLTDSGPQPRTRMNNGGASTRAAPWKPVKRNMRRSRSMRAESETRATLHE